MTLIQPVRNRVITLDEALGFSPPVSIGERDWTPERWKGFLKATGRYGDIDRMERAQQKRARKNARRKVSV